MRAILVSVDYADILAITLPYNRRHFDEVMEVTTPGDNETYRIAKNNGCRVFATESFYDDGALINKWKALEEALDQYGRYGLMCIMDADILWPDAKQSKAVYERGVLYSPHRYILPDVSAAIPTEDQWDRLHLFNDCEFAGYTQIFHADDVHLPSPPWHQQDWLHAGGADSAFQALWPQRRRVRPQWRVLHLGQPGQNWGGRAMPYRDGQLPQRALERRRLLGRMLAQRRPGDYRAERLPPQP